MASQGALRLCELDWFKGLYREIYEVLRVDSALPDPCEVRVLPPKPPPKEAGRGVEALCYKRLKTLWFRRQPPHPLVLAHELIHLIDKEPELEEVYAYTLAPLAKALASRGKRPPTSITKLYNLEAREALEAARKALDEKHLKKLDKTVTALILVELSKAAQENEKTIKTILELLETVSR